MMDKDKFSEYLYFCQQLAYTYAMTLTALTYYPIGQDYGQFTAYFSHEKGTTYLNMGDFNTYEKQLIEHFSKSDEASEDDNEEEQETP